MGKLIWIIWMGPKCYHMYPYRQGEVSLSLSISLSLSLTHTLTHAHTHTAEGGPVKTEEEVREMKPQMRNTGCHQKLEEGRKVPPLELPGDAQPC